MESHKPTPFRCAVVMSFDAAMFVQAKQCVESLRAVATILTDLCVVGIDLTDEHRAWLNEQGAVVFSDVDSLRTWKDAPRHSVAMACRPFLKEIFQGYDVYIWLDADLRFLRAGGIEHYAHSAMQRPAAMTACQEVDPAYRIIHTPLIARAYHAGKAQRMAAVWGEPAALALHGFYLFNAGIFAMHRDCAAWAPYAERLLKAFEKPFHPLIEQDALNLAVAEHKLLVTGAPCTHNWICTLALPVRHPITGLWVRPLPPHEPITIIHLSHSGQKVRPGETMTNYDVYRSMGLTT